MKDCVPATTEETGYELLEKFVADFIKQVTTSQLCPVKILISFKSLSRPDTPSLGLDKNATYIKLVDEALKDFVPSRDYNEKNSMEEHDVGVISDEDMEMIETQLPNPGPSSGYNLELNPNRHNSCYGIQCCLISILDESRHRPAILLM
ncbi:hypothetical protein VTP01DRAFT_2708 [Rhizomucor pusillus]|uniref:uncharacterized protein n=1 Tax=Rhizomucor pusillus TaxID=4840 RepID=UPI00374319BE